MLDVLGLESHPSQDFQRVVQSGRKGVAAAEGQGAEAEREDRLSVGNAGRLVAGGHGELVQVGQGRKTRPVDVRYAGHWVLAWVAQYAAEEHPSRGPI